MLTKNLQKQKKKKRTGKPAPELAVVVQNPFRFQKNIPTQALFRLWVGAVLESESASRKGVCIRITNQRESALLNELYRAKKGPTNVLSFAHDVLPQVPDQSLGDLILCVPVILREAKEQHKQIKAHFAHLVVHGIFHLLGFDHDTPQKAEQMESKEIALLASLGFPNPYHYPFFGDTNLV